MANQNKKKVSPHPEGPKKHAAKMVVKRMTKKQNKNIKRGRKGQAPKERKILKDNN